MDANLERLRSIKSFPSLVKYLRDELDWEFETEDVGDLTYDYSVTDFALDPKSAAKIKDIKQIVPLVDRQPWGIFWVDFAGQKLSIGALRGMLRGLVAKKRASANKSEQKKWRGDDLLFICTSDGFSNFNFAYFRGEQTNRAVLSTFGWRVGDTHLRTLAEFNLPALRFPSDTNDAEGWLKKWRTAFDVEVVTDKFFRDYREIFEGVEKEVKKSIKFAEAARLYTQRLFNRLMFIYFIQKKGWLSFDGDQKYLRALFNEAEEKKENFLEDRLYWVFFRGMSIADVDLEKDPEEALRKKRGVVPPLNGGLFELEDQYDVRGKVKISNNAFGRILDLFERYNFTVEESTPLDVQVAVDPEMLGKVFEELVTGRHETGSSSSMQTSINLQEWFGGIDIYLFDQLLKGRIVPGMRVLDAGCGAGRNLVYFLRSGYEVFGVDESGQHIAQIRKMAAALALHLPAENFWVGSVEAIAGRMPALAGSRRQERMTRGHGDGETRGRRKKAESSRQ